MTEVAPDLNDLLSEVQDRSAGCWATQLTGEAAQFLHLVEQAETNGPANRNAIARVLLREFGVSITGESVRNHLNRKCLCDRP